MAKLKWHGEHCEPSHIQLWYTHGFLTIFLLLMYITDHIFPVLPIKNLVNQYGEPTMPNKLETDKKPSVSYTLRPCSEAIMRKTAVSYIPYATEYHEQAGNIINFAHFEEGVQWKMNIMYQKMNQLWLQLMSSLQKMTLITDL